MTKIHNNYQIAEQAAGMGNRRVEFDRDVTTSDA